MCLEQLIPALANQDGNLDNGYLCAASMILRLYEELTGSNTFRTLSMLR